MGAAVLNRKEDPQNAGDHKVRATQSDARALKAQGIDSDRVSAWLAQNVPGSTPPFDFALIEGGHSNLTFRVSDSSGRDYVLRRPPLGSVLKTAHDMGREHKIISALATTPVPVPPALAFTDDEAVNGAPFYLMEFVDGLVLNSPEQVDLHLSRDSRHLLGERVAEVLADLHLVNPAAVGLGDLGKTDGYLDRQLRRWSIQWEKSKTRELAEMEETHALLVAAKPEQRYTGIVHGDYRLGNMISREDGSVAAVLDWELCTLGDTLADVGYLLNNWSEPEDDEIRGTGVGPTFAPGFPSRDHLLALYVERTGYQVENVGYYCAFQMWRLAAICEGVYARFKKGAMGDQSYDDEPDKSRRVRRGRAGRGGRPSGSAARPRRG